MATLRTEGGRSYVCLAIVRFAMEDKNVFGGSKNGIRKPLPSQGIFFVRLERNSHPYVRKGVLIKTTVQNLFLSRIAVKKPSAIQGSFIRVPSHIWDNKSSALIPVDHEHRASNP